MTCNASSWCCTRSLVARRLGTRADGGAHTHGDAVGGVLAPIAVLVVEESRSPSRSVTAGNGRDVHVAATATDGEAGPFSELDRPAARTQLPTSGNSCRGRRPTSWQEARGSGPRAHCRARGPGAPGRWVAQPLSGCRAPSEATVARRPLPPAGKRDPWVSTRHYVALRRLPMGSAPHLPKSTHY
jgi:hypothetical protein